MQLGQLGCRATRTQTTPHAVFPRVLFCPAMDTLSFLGSMYHFICVFGTHTEFLLFLLPAALQLANLQICLIATVSL